MVILTMYATLLEIRIMRNHGEALDAIMVSMNEMIDGWIGLG